jgi:hypothetical protein
MSGLTVGYLSIDQLDLEIKQAIGTPQEKKAVKNIQYLIFVGRSNFAYFEETPLSSGYITFSQCNRNGGPSNFLRRFSAVILCSTDLSDSSSLLW